MPLFLLIAALASAQPEGRVEIEIRQNRFEGGPIRYSVPVSIEGRAPVDVMLDTGSTGLRLLPTAAPSGKGQRAQRYAYRNGVVLEGQVVRTRLAIGGFETEADVSATATVACAPDRPGCPAAGLPPERFRIGGSGPTNGFEGILGAGLRASDAENPLTHARDQAWIVLLPRPGEAAPGRLILNPSPEERAKFTLFSLQKDPRGRGHWADNAIPACLTSGAARLCAPTLLDSGGPALNFVSRAPQTPSDWPAGAEAGLTFGPPDAPGPSQDFVIGRGAGARLQFSMPPASLPWEGLNAGVLPFYDFAVLYDAKAGQVGLAPRKVFAPPAAP
ncbi:hypothetical protein G5B46_19505 [Caulobacter sp. 602-2]|uniref:Aspartyl protease n=1 Tax=Caulobacter sp. 602-2 TaxID=2710887 RepID=A0A6G4R1K9_9CAUL|nr:hypothetical protein [Caulobacter sp. 602-2]NGM51806.1 hypothetical protein [Caulobacter sp. 602-2]